MRGTDESLQRGDPQISSDSHCLLNIFVGDNLVSDRRFLPCGGFMGGGHGHGQQSLTFLLNDHLWFY